MLWGAFLWYRCGSFPRATRASDPNNNRAIVIITPAETRQDTPFNVHTVFTGLGTGSHTVSIWLKGFATSTTLNPGNFPQDVFIREVKYR